jgi:U3 small nucleolar RNA-associated protein 18
MSLVKEKITTSKKSGNPYARRDPNSNVTEASPPPEKDDTEKALEKLLFGDDDGFYAALKQHRRPLEFEGAVVRVGEETDNDDIIGGGEEEGGDDEDMEEVADNDVSILSRLYAVDC